MSDSLVDWQLLPVTHQKLGLSLFPSIHLHPLAQKILGSGFRLLMVFKITELVLTLEGVVEGGGDHNSIIKESHLWPYNHMIVMDLS